MTADCLVLKIEEHVDGVLDSILFVLYDKNEECFLIRGKRNDFFEKTTPTPYAFHCECASELIDFITFIVCKKSKLSYTLYNFNDLSNDSNEISFEYLKELDCDVGCELAGYDNKNFNRKEILKYLRMLRNVFNYY